MSIFNGHYKEAWKTRAQFFEKQTGIAETRVTNTVWAPKFYNPFNKADVAEDTKLEETFGEMDRAYAALDSAAPADFMTAAASFRKAIDAATRQAGTSLSDVAQSLASKPRGKQMSSAQKKQHELDVENLSNLYEHDLVAIIETAEAALVIALKSHRPDGTTDRGTALAALKDIAVRKTAMQSNVTKGLAWLNKLDRDPTVERFNNGVEHACRDVCAQIIACRGVFNAPTDVIVLEKVDKVLSPFGKECRKLTDDDGFQAVIATSVKLRRSMQALGHWTTSIKA